MTDKRVLPQRLQWSNAHLRSSTPAQSGQINTWSLPITPRIQDIGCLGTGSVWTRPQKWHGIASIVAPPPVARLRHEAAWAQQRLDLGVQAVRGVDAELAPQPDDGRVFPPAELQEYLRLPGVVSEDLL